MLLYLYNMFSVNNKLIISIDGNIGSGKSTFLNILKNKYSDQFYFAKEPVDEWLDVNGVNFLEKFYQDKKRWGYTFQNYAYITRIKELMNGINSDKNIIITERSIYTDKYIFAEMLKDDEFMTKFELDLYNTWFNQFDIKINGQIYIRTELDNCYDRIQNRNRDGENTIDKNYLCNLELRHENWLLNDNNTLILNGNDDFKNNLELQNKYCELFDDYINYLKNN